MPPTSQRDPPHYLRALKSDTIPQRLAFMDCAPRLDMQPTMTVSSWQCGVLGTLHHTSRRHEPVNTMTPFTDALTMWQRLDKFCGSNRRTVLWMYDASFQLRVSAALIHLPALGWEVQRISLEAQSSWVSLKHGTRSLLVCDIKSWCPVEFDSLAADVGMSATAPRNIPHDDDRALWVCSWRCMVLRQAVVQLLEWLRASKLGPFRPTGSGQSYAAFRRQHMHHNILVHDDTRRLKAERMAMWTGRCEAWRHGEHLRGPLVEMDMRTAYSVIARDCEVPAVAHSHIANPTLAQVERLMVSRAVLAHVTVTTDTPCVPCRKDGRTIWPVGTFSTWLWDPELQMVLTEADSVRVREVYTYSRAPVLHDFAAFVLAGADPTVEGVPPVVRRVLKHWSRCLVGRLGLRYRSWRLFARTPESGLRLATIVDPRNGLFTDLLVAGHDWLILDQLQEAPESTPQIPSWIMSECRARLWKAIRAVGMESVYYMDTDSLVLRADHVKLVQPLLDGVHPGGWTPKGRYGHMTIYGPRNIVVDADRRIAGLPRTARQLAPLEFSGEIMLSVKESMRSGELDSVTEMHRKFKLGGTDPRRTHLGDGLTVPIEVNYPNPMEVY